MIKPVIVIELPAPTSHEQAARARQVALAELAAEYHVLVVSSDCRVYEVGRWLWQRALRRARRS